MFSQKGKEAVSNIYVMALKLTTHLSVDPDIKPRITLREMNDLSQPPFLLKTFRF